MTLSPAVLNESVGRKPVVTSQVEWFDQSGARKQSGSRVTEQLDQLCPGAHSGRLSRESSPRLLSRKERLSATFGDLQIYAQQRSLIWVVESEQKKASNLSVNALESEKNLKELSLVLK